MFGVIFRDYAYLCQVGWPASVTKALGARALCAGQCFQGCALHLPPSPSTHPSPWYCNAAPSPSLTHAPAATPRGKGLRTIHIPASHTKIREISPFCNAGIDYSPSRPLSTAWKLCVRLSILLPRGLIVPDRVLANILNGSICCR